jgi:Zn finger protein HypA/HybF involved in hydrogenase expression
MHAVVHVNQREVPVPRYALEVVTTPPKRWTVVPAPRNARVPREMAPQYLVCPNCRERTPLQRSRRVACPRCRQIFEVDWKEQYLKV